MVCLSVLVMVGTVRVIRYLSGGTDHHLTEQLMTMDFSEVLPERTIDEIPIQQTVAAPRLSAAVPVQATPEPAGGQTLVDKLTAANIPFLFYNIPPSEETYQSVVKDSGAFFVGTLPREAGDMQGEILADLWKKDASAIDLNGDGKVQFVEFKGVANNPEAIARTQYSEETAKELGVPLEMVTDVIVADWDTTKANDAMLSTWQSHPEIELVFANNDDMAIGVIAALNQSGYNTGNEGDPAISVIGVDATDAAIEAIKGGKMTATVKQDGDAMGEANIRFMMNYLLNGSFYEGLEDKYTLNEDGVSVYIPYAKITEENAQ